MGREQLERAGRRERLGFAMRLMTDTVLSLCLPLDLSANFYGGDRGGANLADNSIVALDAGTDQLKWYFQAIHHDIGDQDLPPPQAS